MITNELERRERVIETVVTAFMEAGEPVSSTRVSTECGLGLKPASIRSIMKDLENDGFLSKPHMSAGRVPTLKCYRYYVSRLMPDINLRPDELSAFGKVLENGLREQDVDMIMRHMASVLSEMTDLIGVAMLPSFDKGLFDRLEIVNLGGSSMLLVMSLKSGFINTIRITLDRVVPRSKVEETARIMTERLHGLTVSEIKSSIDRCLRNVSGGDRTLVEVIVRKSDRIFSFTDDRNIHVAGLSRLLANSEFSLADSTAKLADMFENKHEIIEALSLTGPGDKEVSIHIGGDGLWESPPLSLVSAVLHTGAEGGAVGIIGPARIHYPRLSALVKYASAITTSYLSEC